MADVRCAALSLLLLAGCTPAGGTPAGNEAGLVLSTPAAPGSLLIENRGQVPVDIAMPIAVEARRADAWQPIPTEFNAVASCTASPVLGPAPSRVRLAAGGSLRVVPWQGYSCSGQCQEVCRANIYAGRGPFRFVVLREPGAVRVVGPAFTMPPEDAR